MLIKNTPLFVTKIRLGYFLTAGYRVKVFSLILDSSVSLSAGIQSDGYSVPETPVRILHSKEEDNLPLFHSRFCLFHIFEIDNNKHVYRQSQVRKPTSSGVEWDECSLIIGMGYWIKAFSLIPDSSVSLSAGIQSAGDLVPETLVRTLHSTEEDNSPFDSKTTCLCQNIEIKNKYICIDDRAHVHDSSILTTKYRCENMDTFWIFHDVHVTYNTGLPRACWHQSTMNIPIAKYFMLGAFR